MDTSTASARFAYGGEVTTIHPASSASAFGYQHPILPYRLFASAASSAGLRAQRAAEL